jgi:hypothetical protein
VIKSTAEIESARINVNIAKAVKVKIIRFFIVYSPFKKETI